MIQTHLRFSLNILHIEVERQAEARGSDVSSHLREAAVPGWERRQQDMGQMKTEASTLGVFILA